MDENTLVCKEIPLRAESGEMPVRKRVLLFTIVLLVVFSLLYGRTVSAETTALHLDGTNWMSGLPDDRYVYEFNIPGTHDSGTKNVWNYMSILVPLIPLPVAIPVDIAPFLEPFARCQDLTIEQQLNQGVRAFDLRITNRTYATGMPDGTMLLGHGDGFKCFRCKNEDGSFLTLNQVLDTMKTFLNNHPTETLIVSVKNEYDDGEHKNVWRGIREIIQSDQYKDLFYIDNRWPALSEVRGKVVLCATNTDALGLTAIKIDPGDAQEKIECSKAAGIDPVMLFYENHWDVNRSTKDSYVNTFLNSLDQILGRSGDPHISTAAMLYSSANYITSDLVKILADIAAAILVGDTTIAGDWETPRYIASRLNPTVTDFIKASSYPEPRYFGFVMTDFAGETAETVWKSNYPGDDWDYYRKYLIRYTDLSGELLHTDTVEKTQSTVTYKNWTWRDKAHPETTYQGSFTPASDMTLEADVKQVKFKTDVGIVGPLPDDILFQPQSALPVTLPDSGLTPVSDKYVFTGWNTRKDGSGTHYDIHQSIPNLSDNLTLWAEWNIGYTKWYIVYDANGGTKAPETGVFRLWENGRVASELPEYGRLTFRGWTTHKDSATVEYKPGDTLKWKLETDQVVLYALWSLNPPVQPIRITFDGNSLPGATLQMDEVWMARGGSLKLPFAFPPFGSEYAFIGWSRNPSSRVPEYLPDHVYSFDSDTKLYAVWGKEETVTLAFRDPLPDASSNLPLPISIVPSMSRNVRIPDNIPEKSGRFFTGWNTAGDGSGTPYAPGSVITLTEDTTLWAQWELAGNSWYVIYNPNGGTKAPRPQIVPKEQDAVLSKELPEAGRMIFRGWTTNQYSPAVEYEPGDTLLYDSEKPCVVLYALWYLDPAVRPVVIRFDANGGLPDTVPEKMSVPKGVWAQIPAQKPAWDAQHDFLGWAVDPEAADPAWRSGDAFLLDRDTVLYAVWKAHYRVMEGAGSIWIKGSGKPHRFTADGSRIYFKELRVDGQPFSGGVMISSGSTVADISADAMETLSEGGHTVTFVYVDGEASAPFVVRKKVPPTGEAGRPRLWLFLILLGIIGAGYPGLAGLKRRNRGKREK